MPCPPPGDLPDSGIEPASPTASALQADSFAAEPPRKPLGSTSVQFSSVAQSCPTLCDPMNSSTPGLPVHHQLPESTQTHVHCVGDAIQPPHPLLSHCFISNQISHQEKTSHFCQDGANSGLGVCTQDGSKDALFSCPEHLVAIRVDRKRRIKAQDDPLQPSKAMPRCLALCCPTWAATYLAT